MPRFAVALLAITCALFAAHPASAAFPGQNGKIAFTAYRDGNAEIYVMNPDGSGQTNLTNSNSFEYGPSWAPDGRKIAFESSRDGNREIYVMNADGSHPTRITNSPEGETEPSWSPDGSKIVFSRPLASSSDSDIFVVNSDGTGETRLTTAPGIDEFPDWSPDGTKIAFDSNRDGAYRIYTMNADGSAQTQLASTSFSDVTPSWSPDGRKLAFESSARQGESQDIYTMNPDGTGRTNLTGFYGDPDRSAAWSPDGTMIAFMSDRPFPVNKDIYVMNADGSAQTRLTTDPEQDVLPDWQPIPPYETPLSASPVRTSLVPTFRQCLAANSEHASPLAVHSCAPPRITSSVASVGTQAAGSIEIAAIAGDVSTPQDEADVSIVGTLSDVRLGSPTGPDYNPNAGGPDMTVTTRFRLTDLKSCGPGACTGPYSKPATATEFDFSVPLQCVATSDPSVGSDCSVNTSADAVIPNAIKEVSRTVVQLFRVRVSDAGEDGVRGNGDDTLFAQQGIYIP